MPSTVLSGAAFGADPGCWPLPSAATPVQRWWRAVAAGGQGRYATARAELAELSRAAPADPLASLALSTRASFRRQMGHHHIAHGLDGAALAIAGADPQARADALVGLAADALGLGRLAASAAFLEHAARATGQADIPRLDIRLAWVRAELALAAGDGGGARHHAEHAGQRAEAALPELRRHRVKSDLVLAAALCRAGDLAAARRLGDAVLADTRRLGLLPLCWAAACLLADIGSAAHSAAEVGALRQHSASFIARHGGHLRSG